jgi:hypothetical protein
MSRSPRGMSGTWRWVRFAVVLSLAGVSPAAWSTPVAVLAQEDGGDEAPPDMTAPPATDAPVADPEAAMPAPEESMPAPEDAMPPPEEVKPDEEPQAPASGSTPGVAMCVTLTADRTGKITMVTEPCADQDPDK